MEANIQIYRTKEVIKRLGVSRTTFWRWVKSGRFPRPVRLVGKMKGWPAVDVERFVRDREAQRDAEAQAEAAAQATMPVTSQHLDEDYRASYSAIIRRHRGRRSLRELAQAVGYTHERLRSIEAGGSWPREELNARLSETLDLDPRRMWQVAQTERMRHRGVTPPKDTRIVDAWKRLDRDGREQAIAFLEHLAQVADARCAESARKGSSSV